MTFEDVHDDAPWMNDPARNCASPVDFDPPLIGAVANAWHPSAVGERAARKLCADCPVAVPCLAYAMADPTLTGVWGGTTTAERHEARKPTKRRSPAWRAWLNGKAAK